MDYYNTASLLLGCLIVCLSLFWWYRKLKYKLPPGPLCLPMIGYLPFMQMTAQQIFKQTKHKIFGCYLGSAYTVIMNDYEIANEAFNNPSLLNRPANYFGFQPGGLGFGGANGEAWFHQRRFVVKALNNIGLGASEWEKNLEDDIKEVLLATESYKGHPLDLNDRLVLSISNNIANLILGKPIPVGDPRRKVLNDGIQSQHDVFSDLSSIAIIFPWLLKTLCNLGLTRFAVVYRKMLKFNGWITKEIQNRRKTTDEQSDEIFIDIFLKQIDREEKTDRRKFFNDYNLCGSIKALLIGGTETSTTSLLWLFQTMAAHPHIQKKIQDEIDQVLGKEGKPMWLEKHKLPYTAAAVLEILRWKTIGPFGVMHACSADTKLAGYDIPKGAQICPNIWYIHHNPNVWTEPDRFKPERFLDKDGSLVTKKADSYMPFSMGKRMCPGDKIALIQVFHYFIAFMQKFHILPLEDKPMIFEMTSQTVFRPDRQELLYMSRD